ncbi:hypothetical protein L218DRAFT_979790 [Marasmius fiardii PR-910]|nr:hypothetical protein L218DRAFT_979790 [Marasmius fiardii PR-910]
MPFINQLLRRPAHSLMASFTSHRILLYVLISTLAVAAAITNALKNHSNFYSVTIYLSKSSRSLLVLANFAFILALVGGHVVQRIFFGALRPNEIERLYDRLWFFITESLLAFTIFRDEFDIPFALMFGFLLFVKSFHWLASDRIEWMDQRPYPGPPLLFHIRMSALFAILWLTDFIMFLVAVENTLSYGVGGMVLFASEYGILMASVSNTIAKYLLSSYELRRAGQRGGETAPPWENKSMWVFYIELTTDFLKLTTYLAFFSVIITFYGLPLNIIRDVYITARSLYTRLQALHRYQIATRNMDERYPNATEQELSTTSDRTCIICREEMVAPPVPADQAPAPAATSDGPNMTPKKLPCGHIFHFHCLRSWLERQQSCPTCRRTVLENTNGPTRPPAAGEAPQGPQQQQAAARNPANARPRNEMGLLGRILGNQNLNQQPPAVQRPFGLAPLPPQGNIGAPNVIHDPAGRVVIQYNIQLPPRQDRLPGDATLVPPAQLQPVQPFNGFEGPGNIWQPWQANDQVPTNATRSSESASTHTSPASSNPNPQTSTTSQSEPERTTNPRQEAALAALRRLGGASGRTTEPNERTRDESDNAGSAPTTQDQQQERQQSVNIPRLIPLYDFDFENVHGTAVLQEPLSVPRATATPLSSGAPSSSLPTSRVTDTSVPVSLPEEGSSSSRLSPSGVHTTAPSLRTLPSTLTDDQLGVLDKLTRDAIDERLRILERVSMSVHDNIEELIRVRSVLPPTVSSVRSSNDPSSPTGVGQEATPQSPASAGPEM